MNRKRCDHSWYGPCAHVSLHLCARPPSHEGMHMCYCGDRARVLVPPAPEPVSAVDQEVLW
jgi:hypothetical protein